MYNVVNIESGDSFTLSVSEWIAFLISWDLFGEVPCSREGFFSFSVEGDRFVAIYG